MNYPFNVISELLLHEDFTVLCRCMFSLITRKQNFCWNFWGQCYLLCWGQQNLFFFRLRTSYDLVYTISTTKHCSWASVLFPLRFWVLNVTVPYCEYSTHWVGNGQREILILCSSTSFGTRWGAVPLKCSPGRLHTKWGSVTWKWLVEHVHTMLIKLVVQREICELVTVTATILRRSDLHV